MASSTALTPAGSHKEPDLANQSLVASKALLAHIKKAWKENAAKAEKKDLLADILGVDEGYKETPIWLNITTKRFMANTRSLKPGKIDLPHPLNTGSEVSICLITAEPQRHYKNLVAADGFPADMRHRVTRVIDIAKLKAKFKTFEAQRKLFSEHDLFLGDSRIVNRLPKLLGKTFYKSTAKRPISVEIQARAPKVAGKKVKRNKDADTPNSCTSEQLARVISRTIGAALVNLGPTVNTTIRIGTAAYTPEQIAANVDAVVKALVPKYVPGQWDNVKSIYIKGPETAALPIWLTDELWLTEKDIAADGSEEAAAILPSKEANVGKKRKSLEGQAESAAEPVSKKIKQANMALAAKRAAVTQHINESLEEMKKERNKALKALKY